MPVAPAGAALSAGYRVREGQKLRLHTISTNTSIVGAWARIVYDNGSDDVLWVPESNPSASLVEEDWFSRSVVKDSGWVVAAAVTTLNEKRGRQFVTLDMDPFGVLLLQGYAVQHVPLALGTYREPGPEGGDGDYTVVTVKADGVPVVTTTYALALAQQLRRIHGFVWYYAADGTAATRACSVILRQPFGAVPTGYPAGIARDVWQPLDVTLTADQNGSSFASTQGSGQNDNGTLTVQSEATPFPLTVEEADPIELIFTVPLPQAGDFDAIYVLAENWLVR